MKSRPGKSRTGKSSTGKNASGSATLKCLASVCGSQEQPKCSVRRSMLGKMLAVSAPAFAHHSQAEMRADPIDTEVEVSVDGLPEQRRVAHIDACKAARQGRWVPRPKQPPRKGMASAAAMAGRMQVIDGCGEQAVDRVHHQGNCPSSGAWSDLAPLLGADHVGLAALGRRIHAVCGSSGQNKGPHSKAFAHDGASNRWAEYARSTGSRGAVWGVALRIRAHLVGGGDARSPEIRLAVLGALRLPRHPCKRALSSRASMQSGCSVIGANRIEAHAEGTLFDPPIHTPARATRPSTLKFTGADHPCSDA